MTPQERQRVAKLLDLGYEAGDSIEVVLRSIKNEMPHLTTADIKQVAAVSFAQAEAMGQIGAILEELGADNLEAALPILEGRAARGDKHAVELLEKVYQAMLVTGMDE